MRLSDFFITIILLGGVQGFIISGLLLFSSKNRRSNRFLSALIFLMALASFNLYLNYKDWFHSDLLRLIGDIVPMVVVMPFGPLIYFYFRSTLEPGFKITRRQRIHFLPVIIDLVPCLTVIVYIIGLFSGLLKNNPEPWGIFIDDYNVYADIPRWISITSYLWLSSRYLRSLGAGNQAASNGQAGAIKWLRQFTRVFLAFQVLWFLYLIPYVIPRYSNKLLDLVDWYPLYIPLAIIIYWLGIKGYMISYQTAAASKKNSNALSSLTDESIHKTVLLLNKSMEEDKLYLNPNLSLHIVSQHTGLAQKNISAVLNQHLNKSFNEYVNKYRVGEFKKKILQPGFDHLTITGIAFECGFNSQATFQRTFKDFTGMSPTEFRKTASEAN
jgi:AraC-like DNA-binding protein